MNCVNCGAPPERYRCSYCTTICAEPVSEEVEKLRRIPLPCKTTIEWPCGPVTLNALRRAGRGTHGAVLVRIHPDDTAEWFNLPGFVRAEETNFSGLSDHVVGFVEQYQVETR